MDLEAEERALGNWPRRLLHVPTLTSHAWQPGNVYGSVQEPKYNAITYTWGRWRLSGEQLPHVRPVPISIDGDEWPIPRVDPKHFTAEEFKNLIRAAAKLPANFRDPDPVEFIWLDIACIHQRDDPRSAAEIGRQAVIFHGAKAVFVWLTTHGHQQLERIMKDLSIVMGESPSEHTPRYLQAIKNLPVLLNDPWFSSLWTLQEAFLRHDAHVLSREARLVARLTGGHPPITIHTCTLSDLLTLCSYWKNACARVSASPLTEEKDYEAAIRLIEERGLSALYSRQELHIYIAAQSRTATRSEDRIYGIQQIFGLRLGNTAPVASGKVFNFIQLEAQLAKTLLLQYPIQSQMHVFRSHVPPRARWRVQPCSQTLSEDLCPTPRILDEGSVKGEDSSVVVHCRFFLDHHSHTPKALSFAGRMSPFPRLRERWNRIGRRMAWIRSHGLDDGSHNGECLDPLYVQLDVADELPGAPHPGTDSIEVIRWLLQMCPDDQLQVLLLGFGLSWRTKGHYQDGMYGLLMLRHQEQWARVGVCQWSSQFDWTSPDLGMGDDDKEFLRGYGEGWTEQSGIFGYVD
ncbi:hypothetical protein BU26DRAFT_208558 [Trematosphaeria pertusa]|uniref:Heterokaryon incompatibility domain-containing protein n=1 Tax=Trematosphaeria pertusa TaxID=390896 RepID=A0A6A6IQJ0_9PLEO|nr:uncharacterized protein BU26DRAFT_208558 [Trematosphaeria pertusa]KAF2252741.1 hypothetical protein BU26DRAFT_208558 [Trematosphaeria pertusa]